MLDGLEDSGRKLDRIVADGLRCIDEAVEGVINELCPSWLYEPLTVQELDRIVDHRFHKAERMMPHTPLNDYFELSSVATQKLFNKSLTDLADEMETAEPKAWPTNEVLWITPKQGYAMATDPRTDTVNWREI